MVSKAQYEEVSKAFRNETCKDPLAKIKKDPKYEYRKVILYYWDPNRVENFESKGWEIVIEEVDGRLSPVRGILPRSAKEFVVMRCLKTRRQENEKEKDIRDKAVLAQSSQRKTRKEGAHTIVTLPEIDLNKNVNPNELGD